MEFVIISGMSGAGKSVAMKAFEDMNYYCVDNIPPVLIPKFVELCYAGASEIQSVALVVDIRGRQFFDDLDAALQVMTERSYRYKILFLECSDATLIKRYKESKRTHPLLPEGSILDGIKIERDKLKHLKAMADAIIDTTPLTIWQLKGEIDRIFREGEKASALTLSFVSFGFKKGAPQDADLLFDVRFLPNPYYIESLRHLTGNDQAIQEFVLKHEEAQVFLSKTQDLISYLLPFYHREGKSQLVIAIGCTGGKHRSVTIANALYEYFESAGWLCTRSHRDLESGYTE